MSKAYGLEGGLVVVSFGKINVYFVCVFAYRSPSISIRTCSTQREALANRKSRASFA